MKRICAYLLFYKPKDFSYGIKSVFVNKMFKQLTLTSDTIKAYFLFGIVEI